MLTLSYQTEKLYHRLRLFTGCCVIGLLFDYNWFIKLNFRSGTICKVVKLKKGAIVDPLLLLYISFQHYYRLEISLYILLIKQNNIIVWKLYFNFVRKSHNFHKFFMRVNSIPLSRPYIIHSYLLVLYIGIF